MQNPNIPTSMLFFPIFPATVIPWFHQSWNERCSAQASFTKPGTYGLGLNWANLDYRRVSTDVFWQKQKSYWQPCCFFTTIMEAKMRKHYTCTWQVRETKHSSPSHTFRDVATFQDSIVVFCCHVATEFSLSRFAFLEHLWVWYSSTASQSMHLHWMMLHGTQADAACIFLNLSAWWPCVAAGYLLIGSNWLVITANAGNQRPTSVRQYVFCPHGFQQITKKK